MSPASSHGSNRQSAGAPPPSCRRASVWWAPGERNRSGGATADKFRVFPPLSPPRPAPGQLGGPGGAASPAATPGVWAARWAAFRGWQGEVHGARRRGCFSAVAQAGVDPAEERGSGEAGGGRKMVRGGAVLPVESSGVTRQRQGGHDPDNLPACLSQAPHTHTPGRGEEVGAGTSPDRLRLLLLFSLCL